MKKIVIVSPMLPCGVSWLINCFLELGIKTYRTPDSRKLWAQKDRQYYLNAAEVGLKQHFPVLSRTDYFHFIDNVEIEWTHEFPLERFGNYKIIYFIRDPRDAFYSWYKRLKPDFSYAQFISMLDCYTLLDRVDCWILFNQLWCSVAQKNIRVFRFEDYKQDALSLFHRILEYCEIEFKPDAVERAVNESTYEKAKASEECYSKLADNQNRLLINRSGKPTEWKDQAGVDLTIADEISRRALPWLIKFGYEPKKAPIVTDTLVFPRIYLDTLTYFDLVIKPAESISRQEQKCAYNMLIDNITKRISRITAKDIIKYEKIQKFYDLILLRTILVFFKKASGFKDILEVESFILFKRIKLHYLFILLRCNLYRLVNLNFRYFLDLGNWMIYRSRFYSRR